MTIEVRCSSPLSGSRNLRPTTLLAEQRRLTQREAVSRSGSAEVRVRRKVKEQRPQPPAGVHAKRHWHLHGGSLFSGLLHAAFAFRLVRRNWQRTEVASREILELAIVVAFKQPSAR
jgi:hypothetical protein